MDDEDIEEIKISWSKEIFYLISVPENKYSFYHAVLLASNYKYQNSDSKKYRKKMAKKLTTVDINDLSDTLRLNILTISDAKLNRGSDKYPNTIILRNLYKKWWVCSILYNDLLMTKYPTDFVKREIVAPRIKYYIPTEKEYQYFIDRYKDKLGDLSFDDFAKAVERYQEERLKYQKNHEVVITSPFEKFGTYERRLIFDQLLFMRGKMPLGYIYSISEENRWYGLEHLI